MKKLLALLLALIMVLSAFALAACNDPEQPNNPDEDEQPDDGGEENTPPDDGGEENTPPDDGDDEPVGPSEDELAAQEVVERIDKISAPVTKENYKTQKTLIERALKEYNELTDAQKAFVPADKLQLLTDADTAYKYYVAAAEKAEALVVNKLISETLTVDGLINIEYYQSSAMTVKNDALEATFRFAIDDTYLYIVESRKGAGTTSEVYFTLDAEQIAGVILNSDESVSLFAAAADKASAAKKDYTTKAVKGEGSYVLETKIPLADLGLAKADFSGKKVGATVCAYDASGNALEYTGMGAWDDCQRFYTAVAKDVNFIANGTPAIDGIADDLYLQSAAIKLNIEYAQSATEDEKKQGKKFVGDDTLADSDLMHATFRFAVDDEYLYIIEHRFDMAPIYCVEDFKQPYKADGSLLWFTRGTKADVGIQWNRALKNTTTPVFGLFFNDAQASGTEMEWEYALTNGGSPNEYVLEVKVPLADLKITREEIESGAIGFSCITVDIVNPECDTSASFGWTGNGYQLQYIGVNSWANAPLLMINPDGSEVGYPVITGGAHDPQFDLAEGHN